jgi:predicted solute-binding protein
MKAIYAVFLHQSHPSVHTNKEQEIPINKYSRMSNLLSKLFPVYFSFFIIRQFTTR